MLKSVYIGYYDSIELGAFADSSVNEIILCCGKNVSPQAIDGCTNLKKVKFGDSDDDADGKDILATAYNYPLGLNKVHDHNKDLIALPPYYKGCMILKIIIMSMEKLFSINNKEKR